MKLLNKIQNIRHDLNSVLLERETAVDAAMLALLTGEHVVFLGPPGTAKSLLVRSVCERITGATYFERLLTKFSTPEELFGPLSLSSLEQDRYVRVKDGTVVEANIAFIDEVFKANSSILNSLLSLMNERTYHESGLAVPVPLLSLFAASNETPEDASLDALYDRFLLRVEVPYITDDASLRNLFIDARVPSSAQITLDDLQKAQAQASKVKLTDAAVEGILAIKHELEAEGITASDRRWKQCAKLIKAHAWLSGDGEATEEHTDVLVQALWNTPDQRRVVERCVSKIANPLNLEAVELEDAALDLYNQRPAANSPDLTQKLEPLLRQLGDIHTRLETRIAITAPDRTVRAKKTLQTVERYHQELSSLGLRSLSKLHTAPGAA